MSPGAELIDEGLRNLEEVQGHPTFVYLQRHWPCTSGPLQRGMDLGIGPPVNQLSRTLTVRKTAVPFVTADQSEDGNIENDTDTADHHVMPPHPGKIITHNQREYEIESIDETEAAWRIHCVSPDS